MKPIHKLWACSVSLLLVAGSGHSQQLSITNISPLAAGTPALAGVQTEPMIEGYAVNLEDRIATSQPLINAPLPLSIELDGMIQKRELAFDGFGVNPATMRHLGVYLGVDVTRWLTLRGLAGSSDFESSVGNTGRIGGGMELGIDVEGRLVNWHVDPMMCNISWIHFDASARYLNALAKSGDNKAEWQEGYGDLTVSLVSIPPDKDAMMSSISVFAGPALSWIDGKVDTAQGVRSDFSEDQLLGFTGGIVLVPHDNIKLKLDVQIFNQISYEAAIGFHF